MVKLGYKQTEIGVIPEDWEISKLGNIGQFKNGINKDKDKFGYGVPIIGLMDVFGMNHINSTSNSGLVDASPYEQEDYSLKEGDVLFVRSSVKPAGVGLTAVVEQTLQNAVFSGFLLRYRTEKMTVGFKRYVFYASYFRENLIAASTVSANTNINQDSLKQLVLAYPTNEAEQNKIAQTISSIDALILSLEKQISKKKAIKQGAMQELLTGKKRLPGCSGEWQHSCLGESAELSTTTISSKLIDSRYYVGTDNMVADRGGVKDNELSLTYANVREYKAGDILLSNIRPYLKKIWYATRDGGCSNDVLVIRRKESEELDSRLLYYILATDEFFDEIMAYAVGTKMPRGDKSVIKSYKICFPKDISEQQAIAEILSNMDSEIEELEQKLEKYRQVKQGMMQQLLTGKIRLV